jgi:2-aminoethylphosphonate-pyruvate transaminase
MPPTEWILLNPGPANTTPAVRHALLIPDLCHREPEFFEVMRECRERLVRLATGRRLGGSLLLTGSGTAAVESMIASAVPPGRSLLVVDNGVYGDRMVRIAQAHGIPVHTLGYDNVTPAAPADVAAALRAHPEVARGPHPSRDDDGPAQSRGRRRVRRSTPPRSSTP